MLDDHSSAGERLVRQGEERVQSAENADDSGFQEALDERVDGPVQELVFVTAGTHRNDRRRVSIRTDRIEERRIAGPGFNWAQDQRREKQPLGVAGDESARSPALVLADSQLNVGRQMIKVV